MTNMTLRSITNSGIWIPMLAPTCSTMISSDEPRCQDSINPVYNSLCLAVWYLPEIRSSVYRYLVQSRYGKSLYSFRNTSSCDQLLDHIVHIMMMSYRVGPEIPLRLSYLLAHGPLVAGALGPYRPRLTPYSPCGPPGQVAPPGGPPGPFRWSRYNTGDPETCPDSRNSTSYI